MCLYFILKSQRGPYVLHLRGEEEPDLSQLFHRGLQQERCLLRRIPLPLQRSQVLLHLQPSNPGLIQRALQLHATQNTNRLDSVLSFLQRVWFCWKKKSRQKGS